MFGLAGILNVLLIALNVLVPVAGVFVIATRTSGSARKIGIAGCAITAGVGILQGIWVYVGPVLVRRSGASIAAAYGVTGALFTIASAVGLALIIAAVVAGRGTRPGAPVGPQAGPPNPYQQYPPQQPYPPR